MSRKIKQLQKLNNKEVVKEIYKQTEKQLSQDLYGKSKSLKNEWKGFWCYRVGDYRITYEVIEEKVLISIFKVGHRRESIVKCQVFS